MSEKFKGFIPPEERLIKAREEGSYPAEKDEKNPKKVLTSKLYWLRTYGEGEGGSAEHDINNALEAFEKAKESGIDTAEAENELPELIKKARHRDAQGHIKGLKLIKGESDTLFSQNHPDIIKAKQRIDKAKEAGVDVADLEEELTKLISTEKPKDMHGNPMD